MYQPGKSPTSVGSAACDICRHPIPFLDFREDRAAVISGKTCCAQCVDEGAWMRVVLRTQDGVLQRRATPRFLPSQQCGLALRLPGWRSFLMGNLCVQWLDVSEGGLRAVVRRNCSVDERLRATILHRPRKHSYAVTVRVRHVQDSTEYPRASVMGMQFENASADLREFIRKVHAPGGFLEPKEPSPREPRKEHS